MSIVKRMESYFDGRKRLSEAEEAGALVDWAGLDDEGVELAREALALLQSVDLAVLSAAVEDGVAYREGDGGHCGDCLGETLCEDHQSDADQAETYEVQLARLREVLG